MTYREIYKQLKDIKRNPKYWDVADVYPDEGEPYYTTFLGTFMYLDPCGRYHHILSPNGISKRCIRFWDNIDKACNKLGMWISAGEGDLCDVFMNKPMN